MQYLTFSAIAKRCPAGYRTDRESGKCIPSEEYDRKYHPGRHKKKEKPSPEPEGGKCPKGFRKDRKTGKCITKEEYDEKYHKNRNKKKEKETDEKKEESKSEVEPYNEGIEKPESLKYVMGVTRRAIEKEHPEYFEQAKATADAIRGRLNDEKIWGDTSRSTVSMIEETLQPFDEYGGITISNGLEKIPVPVMKSIISDFIDTFEEYPYAMSSFGGFDKVSENSSCTMWCSYGEDRKIGIKPSEFSSMAKSDEDYESPHSLYDPIDKGKERTMWGYHFKGSTAHSSISHEWGHACDIALFSMKVNCLKGRPQALPSSIYESPLVDTLDSNEERGMEIRDKFYEIGYQAVISIPYGKNYANVRIALDGADDFDIDKIKSLFKEYGFKVKGRIEKSFGHLWFDLIPIDDSKKYNLNKLQYTNRKELRKKSRIASHQRKSLWKEYHDYAKQRVNECEEMYKKIYGVKNILPTECYTRYGYYGEGRPNRTYFSEEKSKLTDSASVERLAEAMEDVMVRKDKANSMSQLLVAHIEYEYYQLITGKYDLSFKDFLTNEVGLDKFKERIIKSSRYILFSRAMKK